MSQQWHHPIDTCWLCVQVRVAAALTRIAAQQEQTYENGDERVQNWDKRRKEKERKDGESASLCFLLAYQPQLGIVPRYI